MTRKEDIVEAEEAVKRINDELEEKYKEDAPVLTTTKGSHYLLIDISPPNLPEINLYCSEQEERIFYEKSDKYETFYKFIKRKFREVQKDLNKYKL